MFGSETDPSDIGYFEADSAYGKMVLRQAMRMDIHVYRILSARIAADSGTLMAFIEQDPRIEGYEHQRAQQRFNNLSHQSMQLFTRAPEAVEDEPELDDVTMCIIEDDKQS
jgi:tRNA(Arg) A34 adenosine deaminase TadA